jgi:hypothetical protein
LKICIHIVFDRKKRTEAQHYNEKHDVEAFYILFLNKFPQLTLVCGARQGKTTHRKKYVRYITAETKCIAQEEYDVNVEILSEFRAPNARAKRCRWKNTNVH